MNRFLIIASLLLFQNVPLASAMQSPVYQSGQDWPCDEQPPDGFGLLSGGTFYRMSDNTEVALPCKLVANVTESDLAAASADTLDVPVTEGIDCTRLAALKMELDEKQEIYAAMEKQQAEQPEATRIVTEYFALGRFQDEAVSQLSEARRNARNRFDRDPSDSNRLALDKMTDIYLKFQEMLEAKRPEDSKVLFQVRGAYNLLVQELDANDLHKGQQRVAELRKNYEGLKMACDFVRDHR